MVFIGLMSLLIFIIVACTISAKRTAKTNEIRRQKNRKQINNMRRKYGK